MDQRIGNVSVPVVLAMESFAPLVRSSVETAIGVFFMLVFADDLGPGIRRRRAGRGWSYWRPDGTRITDRDEIDRFNRIGLPPAYGRAWFSPNPDSHILATGYDARGRKQYRYHPEFRAQRDAEKFGSCAAFGQSLSRLRARVEQDMQSRGLSKDKVVAAVIRLLDTTAMRVGNERYAHDNRSFGATTLRNRHARLSGSQLQLRFVAKSGRKRSIELDDPKLARVVQRCQDLPGQHLFSFLDDDGVVRPVTSSDVNIYIRSTTGADFTAKHFRTWGASVIAYGVLQSSADVPSLDALLEPVVEALGNTKRISRQSYVHPDILRHAGRSAEAFSRPRIRATKYLTATERNLIAYLESTAGGCS